MTVTDLVLVLFIVALLAYAIYDQFIMPRRNGPTLLAVPLLRRGRVDSVIFVGLVAILIYNNVTSHGAANYHMVIMCTGADGVLYFLGSRPQDHLQTERFFLRQCLDRI